MICHPKQIRGLATVIVPFFNREDFLARTITSILDQDYSKLQLILVDDGSRDLSYSIARSFSDPRIQYIRLTKRQGKSAAINRALPLARGEWINFFDSDDLMTFNSLSVRINFLRRNSKSLSVMGCIKDLIGDSDQTLLPAHPLNQYLKSALHITKRLTKIGPLIPEFFAFGTCPLGPLNATLFRKKIIDRVGAFNECFPPWEDREYLVRAAIRQPIPFIDKPVLSYRVHNHNASFKMIGGKLRKNRPKTQNVSPEQHFVNLIFKH